MFYPQIERRGGDTGASSHVHRRIRRTRQIKPRDSESSSEAAVRSDADAMPNYSSELRRSLKYANSQSKIAVLELERRFNRRTTDPERMENEEILVEEKRALVHIPSRTMRQRRTYHMECSRSSEDFTGTRNTIPDLSIYEIRNTERSTYERPLLHETERPFRLSQPDRNAALRVQTADRTVQNMSGNHGDQTHATYMDSGRKNMGSHREVNVYSLLHTKVSVKVITSEQRPAESETTALACAWTEGFDIMGCVRRFGKAAYAKCLDMQAAMSLWVRPRVMCGMLLVALLAVVLCVKGFQAMKDNTPPPLTEQELMRREAANAFATKVAKSISVVKVLCKIANLLLFASRREVYDWFAKVMTFMENIL